jgi:DUF4097 and DUF4098 domain-containing protein YvlB
MKNETFEHSFNVSIPARLTVGNICGSIAITAGTDEVISVKAVKHLDSGDPEQTKVNISQDEDGHVIAKVTYDREGFLNYPSRPCKVDFEIQTPRESSLKLNAVSSSAKVEGLDGELSIKTVSGNLGLRQLSGDLEITSVSGRMQAEGLVGQGDISSVSGKIELADCEFVELECNSVSGSIYVQSLLDQGPYNFKTVSGRVKLVIPENTPATLFTKSLSGRLKTSIPASRIQRNRNNWKVNFIGGGPEVRMKSVSGNFYVVNSKDDEVHSPHVKEQTRDERLEILSQLENGELSIEEAMNSLET